MTFSVLEDTVISCSTKTPGPTALSVSGTRCLPGAEVCGPGKLQMLFHLLKMPTACAYHVSRTNQQTARDDSLCKRGSAHAPSPVLSLVSFWPDIHYVIPLPISSPACEIRLVARDPFDFIRESAELRITALPWVNAG